MRIAVFIWGGEEKSLYREALRRFGRERAGAVIFSDTPDIDHGELHYLRFWAKDREERFDLLFHNVDDGARFAAAFPYIAGHHGVLFFGDIYLHRFARAMSHSALDGWGYRWILGVTCPRQADALARLAQEGIAPGVLAKMVPLGRALAVRSAAVVVKDFDVARALGAGSEMPPVSVIPPPDKKGGECFAATLERMIPHWFERMPEARRTIPPLEHPHRDLLQVERARVRVRLGDFDPALTAAALERLDELFGE
ncbi:MAG TPA: hypothetical protein VMX35_14545 [Acidobacteriota bacterium]|nr:hypothetical protein [Acidobacteriota bacterium]